MGTNTGMSNHKGEGLWPKDTSCASNNIAGLFAAGDNLCSMQNGANYAGFGTSFCGSAVQGAAAGTSAAEYAKSIKSVKVSTSTINDALTTLTTPREREKGFSPSWVTRALQSTTLPYYVLWSKEEARLQAALSNVLHLKNHIAPLMIAASPHELRLAHETRNMILNAEMKLRASMMRKESRGTHYREDYPYRDDKNFLAWVIIQQKDGEMVLTKKDVPKESYPDSSKSYEHKYPKRYPNELEALKNKA
jgi:succinate dehydrogenase/fumarate reductase flavoprotein subunit